MTSQEHLLTTRIAGFTDHLRMNGFKVGPAETAMIARQLGEDGLLSGRETCRRMKVLLASCHDEWKRFDNLFEAYWMPSGRRRDVQRRKGGADRHGTVSGRQLWRSHLGAGDENGQTSAPGLESEGDTEIEGEAPARLIASLRHTRMKTDLRNLTDANEIAEAEQLAFKLARAMRYRLSRRYKTSSRLRKIDLRKTIRANIHMGGDPFNLIGRKRPDRPVRLVVMLDVSGSMKAYSRFFLQFVRGLVCAWIDADAYLFHTRLVRITDALTERDPMKAMTRLSLKMNGFDLVLERICADAPAGPGDIMAMSAGGLLKEIPTRPHPRETPES